jgi:hypothetical protein
MSPVVFEEVFAVSSDPLLLKLLEVIQAQLPAAMADELRFHLEDDPTMFAAVVSSKVATCELELSEELTGVVRRMSQGTEVVELQNDSRVSRRGLVGDRYGDSDARVPLWVRPVP